jgi:signal transduction histidine kinase
MAPRAVVVAWHESENIDSAQVGLAHLSRRLLEAQEAERRALAHELHDQIGQELTALKIKLAGLQRSATLAPDAPVLGELLGMVDQIVQQVRDLSLGLRPPMLDDLGLASALRWHVNSVTERSGLPIRLEITPSLGRLPAELEMACFRVVQEALTNAVKHARASVVRVAVGQEGSELCLTVRDDGVGFDVAEARKRAVAGASLGLLGMEERVLFLGGRWGLRSAPEQGTEVWARWPLPSTAAAPGQG